MSRKDGTLNSTRKGEQEDLQRPGSTGTGPRRMRNISSQQTGKKLQIDKNITCKVIKKKKKKRNLKGEKKTSKSTIPPSPNNLDNDPPPTLWDLLQVYLFAIRSFITSDCSITYSAGTVGLY